MAEVWIMGELLVEFMRPQTDVELYEKGEFKGPFPSGAPAIFIDTVARLGHSAGIIGGVGKDDFGKCLLDRLNKDNVDCSLVIESESNSTGVAFVTYFGDGSRKFIYHMGNTPAVEAKSPSSDKIKDAQFFHVMGCSLMAEETFAEEIILTMEKFIDMGTKVSFDPNVRTELLKDKSVYEVVKKVMQHCSVFMPGIEELLLLTGEQDVDAAVRSCFENPVLEILCLKMGSQGSRIYTRNKEYRIDTFPVAAVDPTGAGDCYDGAFISGLLEERGIEESGKMAAAAGALCASVFGAMEGDISPTSVQNMINKNKK